MLLLYYLGTDSHALLFGLKLELPRAALLTCFVGPSIAVLVEEYESHDTEIDLSAFVSSRFPPSIVALMLRFAVGQQSVIPPSFLLDVLVAARFFMAVENMR